MENNEFDLITYGDLDSPDWSCDLTFTIPEGNWTAIYEEDSTKMQISIEQLSKQDLIKLKKEIQELFPD